MEFWRDLEARQVMGSGRGGGIGGVLWVERVELMEVMCVEEVVRLVFRTGDRSRGLATDSDESLALEARLGIAALARPLGRDNTAPTLALTF